MRIKRAVVTALCGVALLGSFAGPGASVAAATASASPTTYTVLAGNAKYLVYRQAATPNGRMSIYARTRHGKPQRLISGGSLFIRDLAVSLVGTTLTADEGSFYVGPGVDTTHIHWWKLGTNQSGVLATQTKDPYQEWQGSVPGGFLLENIDSQFNEDGYSVESLDGTVTPLNNPFDNPDALLLPGPSGLVSWGSPVQFEAYGSDQVVTLQHPTGRDSDDIGCPGPTARYFRCFNDYDGDGGNEPHTYYFVPLDGSKVIVINGTETFHATAFGRRIAYRKHGRIVVESSDGTHEKAHSSAIPVRGAFGGLITTNKASTTISLVRNARSQPVTLLGH